MFEEKNKSTKKDKQKITLKDICDDMDRWPDSWAGDSEDIPVGQKILFQFRPFLQSQIGKGRAKSTLKSHSHYLWSLGGEIIREVSTYNENRHLNARELLLQYISESGGPYWRHAYDDNDQEKYDSVCRLLYNFMNRA